VGAGAVRRGRGCRSRPYLIGTGARAGLPALSAARWFRNASPRGWAGAMPPICRRRPQKN